MHNEAGLHKSRVGTGKPDFTMAWHGMARSLTCSSTDHDSTGILLLFLNDLPLHYAGAQPHHLGES